VEALREGLREIRTRQIDLHAEHEKAGLEQAMLLTEPEIDEAAVMTAIEKIGEIQIRMAKLRIQPLFLIKRVLSAEQVARAQELVREHRRRGGPREREAAERMEKWERRQAGEDEPGHAPPE
jgi:Spy/CpxP family protein refolding chaperone